MSLWMALLTRRCLHQPGRHQAVVMELSRQVANALKGMTCKVYASSTDVRLPKQAQADSEIDTVVQPDVLVGCDPEKLDDKEVRGAPDWIVEVLSPATASHDQIVKLAAYERAGVRKVWLVHPTDKILSIYTLVAGTFGRPVIRELEGITEVAAVPGIAIDWSQLED